MAYANVAWQPQSLSIETAEFGSYKEYIISNGQFQARIVPALGAMLQGYNYASQQQQFSFIKGYANGQDARRQHLTHYRGAKLSPAPNRTKAGTYNFKGQIHKMPINFPYGNHQIHGFMATQPFEVVSAKLSDSVAMLKLASEYQGQYPGYPFPYRIEVLYLLSAKGELSCQTTIANIGLTELPIGDGWHPYFQLPGKSNQWKLQFQAQAMLEADDDMIPTGNSKPYRAFQKSRAIGQTHFDTCFLLEPQERAITHLQTEDGAVSLSIWQDAGEGEYRYLQIFTPDERDSIAIEPMTCPPNALNSHQDLHCLKPGTQVQFSWGMSATVTEETAS